MTDDLNFPIIRQPLLEHAPLSMDEFDAFVTEDLENSFDRAAYENEKALRVVNVMFRL